MGFTSFGTLCAFFIHGNCYTHRNICRCKKRKNWRFCCYKCNSTWNCNSKLLVCNNFSWNIRNQTAMVFCRRVLRLEDGLFNGITSLTLPAIALALPQAAILSRVMRSALIETLGEDYIRTARAKGLSSSQTIWTHALRNALIPVLTIIGLQFSFLLAGAIIIGKYFIFQVWDVSYFKQ